nr:methylmalonyl Co-A mutase-associated GTPase MeaB [Desulfobulbaceae bacterium]
MLSSQRSEMPVSPAVSNFMDRTADILAGIDRRSPRAIARAISLVENGDTCAAEILAGLNTDSSAYIVLGITGPPGAGKSTLTDSLISYFRSENKRVGVIAVDPSSPLTGGAILGDRIRMMKHATDVDVVMRSMATRGRLGGICNATGAAVRIMASSGCEIVLIETVGVGQSEIDVIGLADQTIMVLAPGLGDDIQAMKAGILEVADFVAVNKADLPGSDTLIMEMEQVFRDRGVADTSVVDRVYATIAPEGKGVAELVSAVDALEAHLCQSGRKDRQRRDKFNKQVLDWSLELIKPELESEIIRGNYPVTGDPRQYAQQLVRKL